MTHLKIGIIGGSGLGEAILRDNPGTPHHVSTPFGQPNSEIIQTQWQGVPIFLLSRHGPGHTINPSQINYRANLFALKQLGVTHVLASGAVGSLRQEIKPRDLVIPGQIIDKTTRRAGTFYEQAAVHVEFADPFCSVLRQILIDAAAANQSTTSTDQTNQPSAANAYHVHDRGCYVCMEGPAFSTRAESQMHRLWGGDLIGMTAMPEAKLAREAELPYALIALVTDYDCWRSPTAAKDQAQSTQPEPDPQTLLQEILGNLHAASDHALQLLKHAVGLMADRSDELLMCPARQALKLAIWSDKSKIAPQEIQRLAPLWGRYFASDNQDVSSPGSTPENSSVSSVVEAT